MRKLMILLLLITLAACTVPTDGLDGKDGAPGTSGTAPNVHIVNSAWETVYETTLEARAIDSVDFIDLMVSDFNAAHTDDQWRIIYGDVPPIANAPTTDAYIINAALDKLVECRGLARSEVAEKRAELQAIAKETAGTLYIDKSPPVPIPVPILTDYEKYAIYLVAADGSIIAETHCADDPWADYGYASLAEWFQARKAMFDLQAMGDGHGEYVIAGRLYP